MPGPKFIKDRERLEELAPMLKAPLKRQVFVCTGKSCSQVCGQEVMAEFARILEEKGLRQGKESKGRNPMGEIVLTECGSIGFCSIGVAVMVYPDGIMPVVINFGAGLPGMSAVVMMMSTCIACCANSAISAFRNESDISLA